MKLFYRVLGPWSLVLGRWSLVLGQTTPIVALLQAMFIRHIQRRHPCTKTCMGGFACQYHLFEIYVYGGMQ